MADRGARQTRGESLGSLVLLLSRYPDVWDAVAADPELAEGVVEESLRLGPAVPGVFRRVADDTAFHDASWPTDQVLYGSIEAANVDPAVFGDGVLDLEPGRPNARDHLSFGHGPHYCVGATLARAELQETLRALTSTITCPEIIGEVRMSTEGFSGPAELRLEFARRTA